MSVLKVNGVFHLAMKEGESQEEAEDRFLSLLKETGIEYIELGMGEEKITEE